MPTVTTHPPDCPCAGAPLLTSRELAARLAVTPETIRRWVKAGRAEAHRTPTGQLRFLACEVGRLLRGPAPTATPTRSLDLARHVATARQHMRSKRWA